MLLRTDFALTLPHSTNQLKLPQASTDRLWRYRKPQIRGSVYYAAPEKTRDQRMTQSELCPWFPFAAGVSCDLYLSFFQHSLLAPPYGLSRACQNQGRGGEKTELHPLLTPCPVAAPQWLFSFHAVRSTMQMTHAGDSEVVLLTRQHGCISWVTIQPIT